MKLQMTLLIVVFLFLGLTEGNPNKIKSDKYTISPCPETQETDIFLIHGFMLKMSKKTKNKAKISTSSYFKTDKKKFESFSKKGNQTPKLFEKYWKKKGVKPITNSQKCQKIYDTLKENNKNKFGKNIREVFYKVKTKYVVIFAPKVVNGTGPKTYPSPVIMDKKFEIINN